MNDKIVITKDGVETTYVREDLTAKGTGIGLYREVKYCGIEWKIIGEDAEGVLLQTKECLPDKIIEAIFNCEHYDCCRDVKFSTNPSEWRWENSIIRKALNKKFIEMLNEDDLLPMTTTVWLDGESSATTDYVRLLSFEEIQRMPKEEKIKSQSYWSLSPSCFFGAFASVFYVATNGNLNHTNTNGTSGAVAPVIKLKRSMMLDRKWVQK